MTRGLTHCAGAVRTQIGASLVLAAVLCAGCGHLKPWQGHTILVQYSWNPQTQTRVISMDDLSSKKSVTDRQLSEQIARQANQELPSWVRLQKLTRAVGVFHARILQSGTIEITETMHGIDGVSPGFVKDPDVTPEMEAAHAGDLRKLENLIEAGGPVNAQDQSGATALMAAAGSHNVQILRFLTQHGADVSARDRDGDTALTLSIVPQQLDMVQELVHSGAALNCNNAVDRSTFLSEAKRSSRIFHILEKSAVNCQVPSPKHGH